MSSETWKLEKDLCRCCHAEGSFTSLAEPSQVLPQVEIVSEILRRCFDIDICPVEGMYNTSTYTICEPCILQLRDASNFKQQVLQCEERFRDMYRNVTALGDINTEEEEEEENAILYEFKEEYVEMSDDNDAVAAADAHDDAPHTKQPRPEINDDQTDQVEPKKEMKVPEEIPSNVELNKNTATNTKTREVNSKGTTNKSDTLLKRNQTPKIFKNIFTCNDCGKHFGNKRTLAIHIGSHEKIKPSNNLKCKEWAYQTDTQDAIERQSKLYYKNPCFICDLCGYTAKKKYGLLNHFKLKKFHSDILQSSNKPRNDFTKHLLIHTGDKPYSCSFCDYISARKGDLKVHLRIHSGEKPYSCSFCEFKCAVKSGLTRHLRIHTGEKPYSCSFCGYKCAEKSCLTNHIRIHTGEKPYSCSVCGYQCTEKSRLMNHLRIHTGEKPYSCSFCEYKCAEKSRLNKHLRIHTGEKPYSCSFCEYKCAANNDLNKHLKIHTREKKIPCYFCDYKCATKLHLKKHLLIHTGEKPYSCSFCEYKCAANSCLNRHLRIHTGEKPYSCSFCGYKCAEKSCLNKHLRIHTGEKRYSCSFCEYKCTENAYLIKHLRIHTGEKDRIVSQLLPNKVDG